MTSLGDIWRIGAMAAVLLPVGAVSAAVPTGASAVMHVSVHVPDCSAARMAGSEATAGCGALVRSPVKARPERAAAIAADCNVARSGQDDACSADAVSNDGPVEVFF